MGRFVFFLHGRLVMQTVCSDASGLQDSPLAVVRPRSAAELAATVVYAADQG